MASVGIRQYKVINGAVCDLRMHIAFKLFSWVYCIYQLWEFLDKWFFDIYGIMWILFAVLGLEDKK